MMHASNDNPVLDNPRLAELTSWDAPWSGLRAVVAGIGGAALTAVGATPAQGYDWTVYDHPPGLPQRGNLPGQLVLVPTLLEHNLSSESIHETMVSLGVPLARVEQNLEAVNLRQEEAELLRVPLGTAAFLLRRTTYSDNKRASYANYWVRGDRYAFQDTFEP